MINRKRLFAFVAPMAVFVGLLALNSALKQFGDSSWSKSTEYWMYPAQTFLCGALLLVFWKIYPLARPLWPIFGLTIGALVFLLWIAPQAWLGFAPRTDGFNPEVFAAGSPLYLATVGLRFLRLVVVVPLLEEIFWRGFLLRYLIDEKFEEVPLGKFTWLSFSVVVLAFAFSHSRPDWPAAIATGILYNVVIYRTKSLSTCVLAHATTNLFLGIWIMHTRQWGFW
jgi:CAAX prenyl protease-like protein